MKVKSIKINNFKSIYDTLELNFEDVKGFWKISGSVGAGKTTIGEAIIFGLFGSISGKNNPDLISWGQKHGLVEINCVSKGKNIYIKRELNAYGQSPMYVEVDGEELIFTNKRDAQQQLEQEYYDTSRTTLELLCIISFNNFKSLATLSSSDTKKFLDQVLGFHTLTNYADVCKTLKTNNLSMMRQVQSQISNIESQIRKLEEMANISVIEGNVQEVELYINDINTQLTELSSNFANEQKKYNSNSKQKNSELTKILTLGKKLAKEIEFLEKGICPTCGAKIDQSDLQDKKDEKAILLSQHSTVKQYLNELETAWNEYIKKYKENVSKLESEKDKHTQTLHQLKEQEKRISINTQEIVKLKEQINELEQSLIAFQKDDNEWDMLHGILSNTIRSKILESFIPVLNKNILKYTQKLQQPYLVQFDSNFKCNITIYGFDKDIQISSLSTGQLKTVDMIIILGVLGTIIGSNGINIIFLDELFSNLDAKLRNDMCMVLKECLEPDNTMFIISHTELEDRYFDGDIHMKLELKNQFEKHSKAEIKFYNNNIYL
jgi:DNA repair exonuclease SbcCD ATPase subunit